MYAIYRIPWHLDTALYNAQRPLIRKCLIKYNIKSNHVLQLALNISSLEFPQLFQYVPRREIILDFSYNRIKFDTNILWAFNKSNIYLSIINIEMSSDSSQQIIFNIMYGTSLKLVNVSGINTAFAIHFTFNINIESSNFASNFRAPFNLQCEYFGKSDNLDWLGCRKEFAYIAAIDILGADHVTIASSKFASLMGRYAGGAISVNARSVVSSTLVLPFIF